MSLEIGGRRIGRADPLFVIAELGLNHGGAPGKALALVDAAARAGASAVKLQTLRAATLIAPGCPPPAHVSAASLQDFFRRFELDEAAHVAVAARARAHGLAFMSTPFDEDGVDLLERVGCDGYKIASGDVTHLRLIARAAATRKPVVISTGMSEIGEVDRALECAVANGASGVALLHCVSAYPVPHGEDNLRAIATLGARFGVPVGLSDHSAEPLAAALTLALGGSIYERHLVLGADDDAIDAPVSSSPEDLAAVVALAERTRRVLGTGERTCGRAEAVNRRASRRGVYAARDLHAGDTLSVADVVMLRPESEVPANGWTEAVGRRLAFDVGRGAPLPRAALAGEEAR